MKLVPPLPLDRDGQPIVGARLELRAKNYAACFLADDHGKFPPIDVPDNVETIDIHLADADGCMLATYSGCKVKPSTSDQRKG